MILLFFGALTTLGVLTLSTACVMGRAQLFGRGPSVDAVARHCSQAGYHWHCEHTGQGLVYIGVIEQKFTNCMAIRWNPVMRQPELEGLDSKRIVIRWNPATRELQMERLWKLAGASLIPDISTEAVIIPPQAAAQLTSVISALARGNGWRL